MGLGKLVYNILFRPTLHLRYKLNHFGLRGWLAYHLGENSMRKAAANETPVHLTNDKNAVNFCFLTGKMYWHQTVYAIKSVHQQIPGRFRVTLFSDGSLDDIDLSKLKRFAPGVVYKSKEMVDEHLDKNLSKDVFPTLWFLRDYHPFFKRLIDIHCWPGWNIHLDSDMLFFNPPLKILEAFEKKQAIYMQDRMDKSYFVDDENVLKDNYDINCLPNVNGGIIAYNSDMIDYHDLEQKARLLLDKYLDKGPAKIEQTLMSYLLAKQNAQALDQKAYTVFYDHRLHLVADQVVRHYIFKAKLPYFTQEWKKIVR